MERQMPSCFIIYWLCLGSFETWFFTPVENMEYNISFLWKSVLDYMSKMVLKVERKVRIFIFTSSSSSCISTWWININVHCLGLYLRLLLKIYPKTDNQSGFVFFEKDNRIQYVINFLKRKSSGKEALGFKLQIHREQQINKL